MNREKYLSITNNLLSNSAKIGKDSQRQYQIKKNNDFEEEKKIIEQEDNHINLMGNKSN